MKVGDPIIIKDDSNFIDYNTIIITEIIGSGQNLFYRVNFKRTDGVGWKKENGEYKCGIGEGFTNLWSTFYSNI